MSDVAKRQERSEEQKEQEKTKKELNPEWSQGYGRRRVCSTRFDMGDC